VNEEGCVTRAVFVPAGSISLTVIILVLGTGTSGIAAKSQIRSTAITVIGKTVLGTEFRSPAAFEYDASRDEFYVADTLNQRVVVCSADGELQASLDLAAEKVSPLGLALGRRGRIYLTDQETGDLVIVSFRGRVDSRLSIEELGGASPGALGAIWLDEADFLWALDRDSGNVLRLSLDDMRAAWHSPRYPAGASQRVVDLVREPGADLWIVSSLGTAVYRFRSDMSLVAYFGTHGPREEQFSFPVAVRVGPRRNLWVVDKFRHRVAIYTSEGRYLGKIGAAGTGAGFLRFPTDCRFISDSAIAVLDGGNSRIQIYSLDWGDQDDRR
jgi:hypothetical protein